MVKCDNCGTRIHGTPKRVVTIEGACLEICNDCYDNYKGQNEWLNVELNGNDDEPEVKLQNKCAWCNGKVSVKAIAIYNPDTEITSNVMLCKSCRNDGAIATCAACKRKVNDMKHSLYSYAHSLRFCTSCYGSKLVEIGAKCKVCYGDLESPYPDHPRLCKTCKPKCAWCNKGEDVKEVTLYNPKTDQDYTVLLCKHCEDVSIDECENCGKKVESEEHSIWIDDDDDDDMPEGRYCLRCWGHMDSDDELDDDELDDDDVVCEQCGRAFDPNEDGHIVRDDVCICEQCTKKSSTKTQLLALIDQFKDMIIKNKNAHKILNQINELYRKGI